MYEIVYDYGQQVGEHYRTYTRNVVGRDYDKPVGYGPNGPSAIFFISEIADVSRVLREQLATEDITLHLYPVLGDYLG